MSQNNKNKKSATSNKSFSEMLTSFFHNKYTKLALLAIITFCFFSNYSAIFDKKLDQNGDNIYYFSLGKSLAEGNGYMRTIGFTPTPETHYPPGYPLFIAGVLKIFPDNILLLKCINGLLLYLSILLLFFLLKRITGEVILPFFACMLCSLHPELLRWGTIMMSEILYLFLTLLTLYVSLEIYERKLFKAQKWLHYALPFLLLFLVNYIYFVRTMGLSIILSVIAWFALIALVSLVQWRKLRKSDDTMVVQLKKQQFLQRGLLFLLLLVSVSVSKVSWDKRNERNGLKQNTYLKDFNTKLNGEKMTTFEDWKMRIKNNTSAYLTKWVPNTLFFTTYDIKKDSTKGEWTRGIVIVLLLILGLIRLKKARLLLFAYIALTMVVLIFYPEQFGGSRYYTAIIPLLIFLLLNGISYSVYWLWRMVFKKSNPANWQTIILVAFVFIIMFPRYSLAQKNFRAIAALDSWQELTSEIKMVEFLQSIEWCKYNLPKDARMLCRKPELYYMYSGYKQAEMFPRYAHPDSLLSLLERKKITHVIIDSWYRHAYVTMGPMINKYPEKFKKIYQGGITDVSQKRVPTYVFQFNAKWGYYGTKVNGKKQGKGYELYSDGRKYVGNFANNLPNGYGEYYDLNGLLLAKGIWRDGKLITATP
ncbi:MAG: glycosyltransferase family 39 protein [Paludibacteraceae bacterium]|nr:glycosyltransferase family 39 protein [Paludibacteraceae bacterium]